MIRLLIACTGCINAFIGLTLSIEGFIALDNWEPKISNARGSEEFGVGMLVGGLAVIAWLLAVYFAIVAYLCWRSYRMLEGLNSPIKGDYAVLIIGLLSALIILTTFVARFFV
jgi:hypothetical protein